MLDDAGRQEYQKAYIQKHKGDVHIHVPTELPAIEGDASVHVPEVHHAGLVGKIETIIEEKGSHD